MATAYFFAESYPEARAKFLKVCQSVGAMLTEHQLPNCNGPNGETLFVDVAQLGADNPKSLLILISGTHGVEGFCGSGCQVGYLADRVYEALPADARVLLVHALNPFGFAWLRRVNEDNVDLNRNFQDFSNLPSSAGYEAFHDYLVPKDWEGDERVNADAALQKFIAAKGEKGFQAELTKGQYTRPNGLFYGGREASWSNRVLGDHPRALAVLGLGQPGALDPPVQRGAPAQQAIGALDHIAPVLAAHIAPAAEEAGRHAVGRAGGGMDRGEKLDRRLEPGAWSHISCR